MNKDLCFKFCLESDLLTVIELLEKNDLPTSDICLSKITLILAVENKRIIGCIGVEVYETEGLLRSLAVAESFRGSGIGNKLLQHLLAYSKRIGIKNLHLLTTTADKYFLSKGFLISERENAPNSIRATTEFSTLCPASSVYMIFTTLEQNAHFYSNNLQIVKKDAETQSHFLAISGQNVQFTYFEVPPSKTFEKHSHESEQITHVIEGELWFEIGGEQFCVSKGDSIVIPSNIPHKVWTNAIGAKAVDAWSPLNKNLDS
ncbi:MAG: arsenic resistance N-acetyltransferase ArsN2 [Acidobacteriota bacterium]